MALPAGLEERFKVELAAFEEEKKTPYVTSIERLGMKKGREDMARENVLEALEIRFGTVPEAAAEAIREIAAIEDLRALHRHAIETASLEEFERRLEEMRSRRDAS